MRILLTNANITYCLYTLALNDWRALLRRHKMHATEKERSLYGDITLMSLKTKTPLRGHENNLISFIYDEIKLFRCSFLLWNIETYYIIDLLIMIFWWGTQGINLRLADPLHISVLKLVDPSLTKNHLP